MTTQQQIEANRNNAQKSTGPKSESGQKRTSQNATKHGLSGKTILIRGESQTEYDSLFQSLIIAFKPYGAMEVELVERITIAIWRLKRIPIIEAGLFAIGDQIAGFEREPDPNYGIVFLNMGDSNGQYEGYHALGHLLRHEAVVERSFYQALHALERMQAKRCGEHVSVPHVAEVKIDVKK
jgi:hypothetical protein